MTEGKVNEAFVGQKGEVKNHTEIAMSDMENSTDPAMIPEKDNLDTESILEIKPYSQVVKEYCLNCLGKSTLNP